MAWRDSFSLEFFLIFHSWVHRPSHRMATYSGTGAGAAEAGATEAGAVFDVIVCSEGAIELSVG